MSQEPKLNASAVVMKRHKETRRKVKELHVQKGFENYEHECRNWERGPGSLISGNTLPEFSVQSSKHRLGSGKYLLPLIEEDELHVE